jgi:hypothetical protein
MFPPLEQVIKKERKNGEGKLEGKTDVITAATSGMAFAGAKLFVEEDACIFISGRRKERLDEAMKSLDSTSPEYRRCFKSRRPRSRL